VSSHFPSVVGTTFVIPGRPAPSEDALPITSIEATAVSSKETTLRSSGTRRPARCAASSAPSACTSLAAKIAVGGSGSASSSAVAGSRRA
jgi:hypothetical protein